MLCKRNNTTYALNASKTKSLCTVVTIEQLILLIAPINHGYKLHGKNVKPQTKKNNRHAISNIQSESSQNTNTAKGEFLRFTAEEYSQIKALLRDGKNQSYANVVGITKPYF